MNKVFEKITYLFIVAYIVLLFFNREYISTIETSQLNGYVLMVVALTVCFVSIYFKLEKNAT
jgi:hypothetical protein